ncbi:MAG TPA: MBL fold metallo-hydrolase [Blastocatellia bacterium]|nr:MBL fold metallo-hydrolase [Blastocatellia bacterium]
MKKFSRRLLVILGFLFAAFGFLAYSFAPVKLDAGAAPSFSTQQKRDPAQLPEVSLSLLKAGKMPSRKLFAYRGGSAGEAYENGMAAILVRHPQASFLIDAGYGANVAQHWQTIPWTLRKLSTYVKETPAAAQLQQHGIAVNFAVITHSHWDHISGLEDFPGLEVRMPNAERAFIEAHKYPGLIDQMIGKLNVRTFDFTGGAYENFDRSLDVFGDGSVVLVPLPGHTDGSLGVFVNLRSGKRFLFTGDLTWALEGFELPAERPWMARKLVDADEAEVRRSIVKVHWLMKKYPDLIVVPAHDRRVHERIANLPNFER